MKNILNQVLAYFPTEIPTGMTQFNRWLDSVTSLVGPVADEASLHWVICNEVMRLPSGRSRVPKIVFVRSLRKYAANQIAASIVNDLRAKEEAKRKAAVESAKTQVEDTAATLGIGNEQEKAV